MLGTLREIYRERDPLKVFDLDDTPMSRAMLGPIGRQPVGQITVHAQGVETVQLESFTAFVPCGLVADSRIRHGIAVSAELEGVQIVGGENGQVVTKTVWLCDELYIVG